MIDEPQFITLGRSLLVHEVHDIRLRLERYAGVASGAAPAGRVDAPDSPLEQVCDAFDLSAFERAVLVMCAGVEIDPGFAQLCAKVNGDDALAFPTFGLAMATLPDARWSAMSPVMPLRRWNLIETGEAVSLARTPLRIDEAVLHFLLDGFFCDEALADIAKPLGEVAEPISSHAAVYAAITAALKDEAELDEDAGSRWPTIQVIGPGARERRAVVVAAVRKARRVPFVMASRVVPPVGREQERLVRRWNRMASLLRAVLILEVDQGDEAGRETWRTALHFAEAIDEPVVLSTRDRGRGGERPMVVYEVTSPSTQEQRHLWAEALGLPADNGLIDDLAGTFDLGADAIRSAAMAAHGEASDVANDEDEAAGYRRVWDAARRQLRPDLAALAQRVEGRAGWDDLVVAPKTLASLREITDQTRLRGRVREHWGFGRRSARGQGVVALFSGGSGTGKTLAAEVLANEVGLDLYRIDLSAVVDKYIGETEKNLSRLFDAADSGGSILFFDEADVLFGKRSEVKDGRDRYANIEVGYLLQRLETYRGLAILSTNLREGLDAAFVRRIRFMVDFGFPDQTSRARLWRNAFPPEAPLAEVDFDALADLHLSGGQISTVAVNAAFLAAAADADIGMPHILAACRQEFAKTSQIADHPLLKLAPR